MRKILLRKFFGAELGKGSRFMVGIVIVTDQQVVQVVQREQGPAFGRR